MTDIEKMLSDLEKEVKRVNDEQKEKEDTKEKKKGKIIVGSVAVLLAAVTAGYVITRESKKGQVKIIPTSPTTSMNDTISTDSRQGDNLVIETTNKENEIDQDKFEDLAGSFTKKYGSKISSVSTEDIVKFIALTNIDNIYENNTELAKSLFDKDSSEEFFNDAFKVIGAVVMYDFNEWNQNNSTKNFIKVSDVVIGSQKDKMIKIENYVDKIAKAANDNNEELVNKIVSEFLNDMNSGELSKLDDGVGFASQIYIAVISDGIAHNYLNQENFDMLQVLKESNKYISNMFAIYNECNKNIKTLGR